MVFILLRHGRTLPPQVGWSRLGWEKSHKITQKSQNLGFSAGCLNGNESRRRRTSSPKKTEGGIVVTPFELAYMAHLGDLTTGKYFCGGAVLGSKWVITTAGCVAGKFAAAIKVALGQHNSSVGSGTEGATHSVMRIVIHPNYTAALKQNDIALIELRLPVDPADKHISKVTVAALERSIPNGVVSGWGIPELTGESSSVLKKHSFGSATMECRKLGGNESFRMAGSQFCTISSSYDFCQTELGSPFVITHAATPYLVGLNSFGHGCSTPWTNTAVHHFTEWIKLHVPDLSVRL